MGAQQRIEDAATEAGSIKGAALDRQDQAMLPAIQAARVDHYLFPEEAAERDEFIERAAGALVCSIGCCIMSQFSTAGPNPLKSSADPDPIAVSMIDARAASGLSRSSLYYINAGRLSDCTLGGKRLIIYSELKSLVMSGVKPRSLNSRLYRKVQAPIALASGADKPGQYWRLTGADQTSE